MELSWIAIQFFTPSVFLELVPEVLSQLYLAINHDLMNKFKETNSRHILNLNNFQLNILYHFPSLLCYFNNVVYQSRAVFGWAVLAVPEHCS